MKFICSKIAATGSYLPSVEMPNDAFLGYTFYNNDQTVNTKPSKAIVDKLGDISGIIARRYVPENLNTSDLAYLAGQDALDSSGIDKESLDYIIVAHNFGDVLSHDRGTDMLPNIAAKVKQKLGIMNSNCVAYDILFGCPSWVQAVIQADYFIKSGDAKRIMIIGSDVMSRVLDPHDLDSMLFGDGAGAVILEGVESDEKKGIICHKTVTDSVEKAEYLRMGCSYNPADENIYVKMQGRSVYKYAMEKVPAAIDECLKKAGVPLQNVSKILMHQANEKMIRQLVKKLYEINELPDDVIDQVMPVTVTNWGNSSAATIPMLLDWIMKGRLENHSINLGDVIVMSSVGGGMHANCVVYQHI